MQNLRSKLDSIRDANVDYIRKVFVEVQALYMLLWSALDRFLTFRYGKTKRQNVKELSQEQFFQDALHRYIKKTYSVSSAENLDTYELNPYTPTCSAFYFYELRNNVVHGGKMNHDEVVMLWNSLVELFNIFKYIINVVEME